LDQPKRGRRKRLDGKQEALLVALACSDAPDERESWTMQLLADKLVELKVVEQPISDETVRRTLKKTTLNPGSKSSGASQR
jgi:transposase